MCLILWLCTDTMLHYSTLIPGTLPRLATQVGVGSTLGWALWQPEMPGLPQAQDLLGPLWQVLAYLLVCPQLATRSLLVPLTPAEHRIVYRWARTCLLACQAWPQATLHTLRGGAR